MGVQSVRSGSKIPVGARPKRRVSSPIDKAKGYEIIWPTVSPLFEAARGIRNVSFVYFVGEDKGPLKIGVSKDPIGRLRAMQTGNPRRLRIEQVLLGTIYTERLLHEMWESYAIFSARQEGKVDAAPGTEWFREDIREKLLPIIATAAEMQITAIGETRLRALADPDVMHDEDEHQRLLRVAHGQHGFVAMPRDEIRVLAKGSGYVTLTRKSRI